MIKGKRERESEAGRRPTKRKKGMRGEKEKQEAEETAERVGEAKPTIQTFDAVLKGAAVRLVRFGGLWQRKLYTQVLVSLAEEGREEDLSGVRIVKVFDTKPFRVDLDVRLRLDVELAVGQQLDLRVANERPELLGTLAGVHDHGVRADE